MSHHVIVHKCICILIINTFGQYIEVVLCNRVILHMNNEVYFVCNNNIIMWASWNNAYCLAQTIGFCGVTDMWSLAMQKGERERERERVT